MAQLILTAAQGVGSAVAKGGIGAFLARTVATTAASYAAGYADRLIFGPRKRKAEGPRLESFSVQASQEGAPILRVYGRARLSGQLIWAANFKEATSQTTESSGGKGARPAAQTTYTEYLYSISFAVGLCEGEIDRIGRVWADGKPFDLSKHNVRIYRGTETQNPDALIEATEGVGAAPAFRGLAYIVFEDLTLKDFGNRIPQLSFEIEKGLKKTDSGALENNLTAVTMIPGSGEFVYGTTGVNRIIDEGITSSENIHNNQGVTDFVASLDALEAAAPNLQYVSLVAAWFGDSLNAGACALRPGVEADEKETAPYEWKAAGVTRTSAHLVSTVNGAAAYGGTPADRSVIEAIQAMNARGLKVMFHPFILMDTSGYPWRGRIDAGANDKTAAATSGIAGFFGTAAASDFSIANGEVIYSGPAEWSFRRMILHYAKLCALAGGVDAFLLASELRGITTTRDDNDNYPAVAQLISLAAEVRSILGSATKISYAADWSEYFGHQPADGSGDVFFHLDDLWMDSEVDFIGVDNYMPLADWRDGFSHLDAAAGAISQYDPEYLKSNVQGGEGYDWYYASLEDRDSQTRTPITDGAFGEPWIYRYKDFWSWWSNAHHNRPGGVRDASPTSWVPESKPIYFTETGAPAVDKAANQPNVFVDAKSDESALPHFSTGYRDDLAQRRYIEAQASFWREASNNPISSVYGGPMIDTSRQYVYAVDARPFPDFPARSDVWGDTANWEKGHWLNGRLGRAPLDLLVTALAAEVSFENVEATGLEGVLTGYVVDRPMSAREMIDPLADVFQFDMVETGDVIRFQLRHGERVLTIDASGLADRRDSAFSLSLAQEADLPAAFRLGFFDEQEEFAPAVAEARDPGARPNREAGTDIAAVIPAAEAEARARSILADAWVMRESLEFSLPPSALAIEPGDAIILNDLGSERRYRILEIDDANARDCSLVRVSPSVYDAPSGPSIFTPPADVNVYAAPVWALMDLPLLSGANDAGAPWLAAFADPWPGGVALYRSSGEAAPSLAGLAPARAVMGRLETALPPAGAGRFIERSVEVRLLFGALSSKAQEDVFAGANAFAVQSDSGAWEVCQFRDAVLKPSGAWELSGLLRGQAGSEAEALAGAGIGARFVLLTPSVTQVEFNLAQRGLAFDWQAGPEQDLPDTENFTAQSLAINARGLEPLSPVHLRARRQGSDIAISWIRRTREGGDTWEGEVPLGEQSERYSLTIYDGENLVHEVETTTPSYVYASADITTDFGGPYTDPAITFAVAQISDAVGAGAERKESVTL
ncbi:glycoside hydrolase/phage tail family protein [Hyphococcus flavus]|uniref:Glycoside hydrolase/phage tail family protein n=1 Tax=Hyphococcus flavus TaxID=1866326 RepID=A0AAE9ZK76_9PROT|nr:glycoside hydrolase/phage tail family protein [Hyphococcus flavus]WDI32145.1 glycoside hydrolase/phage tail family protein [Hyphococcus flavus]